RRRASDYLVFRILFFILLLVVVPARDDDDGFLLQLDVDLDRFGIAGLGVVLGRLIGVRRCWFGCVVGAFGHDARSGVLARLRQSMIARFWAIPLPERTQQRLLEILPGALTWLVLLTPVAVAFAIRFNDPSALWILGAGASVLDFYWLMRTAVTVTGVRKSLRALQATATVDWWGRCQQLERSLPAGAPRPSEIVHCALIPTYTERYEVLRATV